MEKVAWMQHSQLFSSFNSLTDTPRIAYRCAQAPIHYPDNNWLGHVRASESGFTRGWRNHDAQHHCVGVHGTRNFSNSTSSNRDVGNGSRHARESAASSSTGTGLYVDWLLHR